MTVRVSPPTNKLLEEPRTDSLVKVMQQQENLWELLSMQLPTVF